MAAGVPVDDALDSYWPGERSTAAGTPLSTFSGSPPPIMGLQQRLGHIYPQDVSPLSYSQPIALSICEKRRQVAAVGHWASFSCRASNSEGEMQGLKLAIVFLG